MSHSLFVKQNELTPVAAGLCAMFMMGKQVQFRQYIAPSLLSCISLLFLSEKVGFLYHVNCGVFDEKLVNTILHALDGNKINRSNVKVVLAMLGSSESEVERMNECINYLVKKGFQKSNLEFVYDAPSYSVNTLGQHGVFLKGHEKKASNF